MADQVLVLMKRGEATMFVPTSKVAQYEADGWIEISRPPTENAPIAAEAPDENAAPSPKAEKPKGRGAKS